MSTASADPLRLSGRTLSLGGPLAWQSLTATLLAAGMVIGALIPVADVSWLLIAGERLLQGDRLYIDILEVNPPLAVFIYMPALVLAHPFGVQPEIVVAALCGLGAVASLVVSGAILKPLIGPDPARTWKLAAAGAFVLGVLPMAAFGEREHIAVIAILPFVAVCILRSEGLRPSSIFSLLAGLSLGLAVCLKPHFAAVGAAPALWAAARARRLRPWSQIELWAGAAMVAAYTAVILVVFPGYLKAVVPLARAAYLPIRAPLWQLLLLPGIPLAVGVAVLGRVMRLQGPWLAAPMAGAVGGAVAFVMQGKGWPYHAYPMLAFAVLGLLLSATMTPDTQTGLSRPLDRLMLFAPAVAAMVWLSMDADPTALARQVTALGASPRLIAVSGNLGIGIPVARASSGRWVGREPSLWISDGVLRQEESDRLAPAKRAALDALASDERARLASDIVAGRPNVILFDRKRFDWKAWALKDPDIVHAMRAYRLAATVKGVEVWARSGR